MLPTVPSPWGESEGEGTSQTRCLHPVTVLGSSASPLWGLFRSEREDTSQGPPHPYPGGVCARSCRGREGYLAGPLWPTHPPSDFLHVGAQPPRPRPDRDPSPVPWERVTGRTERGQGEETPRPAARSRRAWPGPGRSSAGTPSSPWQAGVVAPHAADLGEWGAAPTPDAQLPSRPPSWVADLHSRPRQGERGRAALVDCVVCSGATGVWEPGLPRGLRCVQRTCGGVGGFSPPQEEKVLGGWVGSEPRAARARPGWGCGGCSPPQGRRASSFAGPSG